jgi:hypothetical protein
MWPQKFTIKVKFNTRTQWIFPAKPKISPYSTCYNDEQLDNINN